MGPISGGPALAGAPDSSWCGKEAPGTDGGTQPLPLILSPSQQGQESVLVGTETYQVPLSTELGTGAENLISL